MRKFLPILALITLYFCLLSCEKKEKEITSESLVGIWHCERKGSIGTYDLLTPFKNDKDYLFENGNRLSETSSLNNEIEYIGTYAILEGKFIVSVAKIGQDITYDVVSLQSDRIELYIEKSGSVVFGEDEKFTTVSENVVLTKMVR